MYQTIFPIGQTNHRITSSSKSFGNRKLYTNLYMLIFDPLDGFGLKIGFCESVLKWRYRAVLNYLNIKGLKIIKKFFLQDFKNFLYFFISK